jgi:hypothetical protein
MCGCHLAWEVTVRLVGWFLVHQLVSWLVSKGSNAVIHFAGYQRKNKKDASPHPFFEKLRAETHILFFWPYGILIILLFIAVLCSIKTQV